MDDQTTTVLLLDSHWITRTALRMALAGAGDLETVAEAEDCDAVVATMSAGHALPDVLVITGAFDPAAVITTLTEAVPAWPVRVLMIGGDEFPEKAFDQRCTAAGWLPQSSSEKEFVAAVRLIAAGHWVVPCPVPTGRPSPKTAPVNGFSLTAREHDVLRLVAEGYTNAEISTNLQLGESTVKSHVQNLLTKLGARNRVRAAIYAYEAGLISACASS